MTKKKNEFCLHTNRCFVAIARMLIFKINGWVAFSLFLFIFLANGVSWTNSAGADDLSYESNLTSKLTKPKNHQYRLIDDLLIYDESGNLCGFLKAGTILNSPHAWDVPDTDIGDNTRLKLLIDLKKYSKNPAVQLQELTGVHPYEAAVTSDVIDSFRLILKQDLEQSGPG